MSKVSAVEIASTTPIDKSTDRWAGCWVLGSVSVTHTCALYISSRVAVAEQFITKSLFCHAVKARGWRATAASYPAIAREMSPSSRYSPPSVLNAYRGDRNIMDLSLVGWLVG